MLYVSWIIHSLLIMLSVAFFTLFERKCIGLFQSRVGPNKVSLVGLLQPLLDAFKLLSKQRVTPLQSNKFVYNRAPHIALGLALFVWLTMPRSYLILSMNYSLLLFFCVSSVMVFSVLLSGWSSNSKYSLIGALRSVAQSISYEAVFSTLTVLMVFLMLSYSIRSSVEQCSILYIILLPLWFICSLAETYRAPFDFRESESELVSGFNTEYAGAYFAFIFLSEYAIILYSCMLISYLFFRFLGVNYILFFVFVALLISFTFIWVRVTFCRFRYDILIISSWKILLPLTLRIFIIYLCLMFII